MLPDAAAASPRRARRVALLLLGASLMLAVGGAVWFFEFASQVRNPIGLSATPPSYRLAPPRLDEDSAPSSGAPNG